MPGVMIKVYCELHAKSAFSYLEGGSLPETLAEVAAEKQLGSLAQIDKDNISGAVRFTKKAEEVGVKPIIGAEVSMFDKSTLPLIPISLKGYQNLCSLITLTKLRSEKGENQADFEDLERFSEDLICLTGSTDGGFLPEAIKNYKKEPDQYKKYFKRLKSIFKDRIFTEVQRHLRRDEEFVNQMLFDLADGHKVPPVATNGVFYANSSGQEIADLFTCIREGLTFRNAGKLLSLNGERYLKTHQQMMRLFSDHKKAVEITSTISDMIDFSIFKVGYKFPDFEPPNGESMPTFLRRIVRKGCFKRYGTQIPPKVKDQIEKELFLIEKLDLCGYFLVVWDIVDFCEKHDIMVQGRGSAANSAVCFVLNITAVDPATSDLLFERFISEERDECPDIDLDLPSGPERELVIQHLYRKYGQHGAAMTANVITYRQKSAIREVGKSFEIPEEEINRLSKLSSHFRAAHDGEFLIRLKENTSLEFDDKLLKFVNLVGRIQDYPRHLGQHSGGMIIFKGKLDQVVPLEPASMPDRVVVQWDKEDCADIGIIKVDLLGLGMMAALRDTINLAKDHYDVDLDLYKIPKDDKLVYKTLQKADTIGMFQVESRAQMSSLPKTKPSKFYDLVVQVAIIRPGPIVGQMLQPYTKRKAGKEEVDYLDPMLEPILKKTLGVPLFQEQLLRIAMVAGDFSGGEAEELRRAFGFKRADKRVPEITEKLLRRMKKKGINPQTREKIALAINSFAIYGFPESHAASFAILTYASAYFKCHFLAAFTVGILNNYPMGFYSPATIVKDAERKGQKFLALDINASEYFCIIEGNLPDLKIRIGFKYVKGLRKDVALHIAEERKNGTYKNFSDLLNRVPEINKKEIRQLAKCGALIFDAKDENRRRDLWLAELEIQKKGPLFENLNQKESKFPLFKMSEMENLRADFETTSLSLKPHPMAYIRKQLEKDGVLSSEQVQKQRKKSAVSVCGAVICRQRPSTAKGVVFISLEDEFGISNFIVLPDVFEKYRSTIVSSSYLLIKGQIEKNGVSTLIKGMYFEEVRFIEMYSKSHDFH